MLAFVDYMAAEAHHLTGSQPDDVRAGKGFPSSQGPLGATAIDSLMRQAMKW